tara:strand:- start:922 stop:1110 length:189 start_codon:yes stop_codon:yes gene_type:complete
MKYFSTFKQELFETLRSVMEDDGSETIYGMDRDKYMKLSDEEKDKVKAKYHREKHEMETTSK